MNIQDGIYGKITITDPLILKIINTPAFQRLKRVNQYGGVNFVYPDKYQTTRFDHSIGVWWILKTLGTNQETQIAGLLHDIGHTAFSHMVDMAMALKTEDYHEKNLHRIPGINEIYDILKSNSIILKSLDDYGEIKRNMPNVGADRVDYAVRDYFAATGIRSELGKRVLNNITLKGDQIVFKNLSIAREYSLAGLDAMWLVIYEPSVAIVYSSLINIIRLGMIEQKWLSEDDLYLDDIALLNKIMEHKREIPDIYIRVFTAKFKVKKATSDDFDFHHVKKRSRYFDPFVIVENGVKKLSEIDKDFEKTMKKMVEKFDKGKEGEYYKVQFLD